MNIQLTKYLERLYKYEYKSTIKPKPKKYRLKLVSNSYYGQRNSVYELEVL